MSLGDILAMVNQRKNNNADQNFLNNPEFMSEALKNIEKMAQLHLNTSSKIIDNSLHAVQDISKSKDLEYFFKRINELSNESFNANVQNCQQLCNIINEMQVKFNDLCNNQLQNYNISFDSFKEQFNYKPSMNNINSYLDTVNWFKYANQAINNLQQVTSQIHDINQQMLQGWMSFHKK
jgi:hypothetical protein